MQAVVDAVIDHLKKAGAKLSDDKASVVAHHLTGIVTSEIAAEVAAEVTSEMASEAAAEQTTPMAKS